MDKEYKYCKFCGKEKTLEDFCRSGSFIKNICKECNNAKQKKIYKNSKNADIYKQALNEIRDKIVNIPNYRELHYFDGILQIIDKYTKEDD